MREALAARHIGRVLRAFRKHPHHWPRRYSQEIASAWLNVGQSYVSRVEKGAPPSDLKKLTHIARTLRIPDHLLWFTPEDIPTPMTGARTSDGSTRPDQAKASAGCSVPAGTMGPDTDIADDWRAMERRLLLKLAAMTGGGILTAPEQKIRHLADMVLTTPPRTLEDWEIVCADHLYAIRTRSPIKVREDMMIDLLAVRRQLHEASGEDPRELQRVHAALATLYANVLTRLGDHGAALRWWRTAREAADICGDPDLRLVVRGSEAGFGLYGQRSPETVLRLTQSARSIRGNKSPVGLAKVVSSEAKALSLLGRHDEAKQRTLELEKFAPGESVANPIPNIWTTDQVHFTQAWVFAGSGDESAVAEARSLVLVQSVDYQYFANVRLHQAICTVVSGGIDQGVGEATALLDALPDSHRSQMITETANRVLQSVPLDQRNRDSVNEFREILIDTAPEVRSLNCGA
ncbi:hypothetical protein [Actinomadura sp. NBRC 104412]|uniref:helix-turn-helix domain-containing protein n=1 Tax=Actinomadura sp. NBRC 104412 TaxID=3032203 RepID=UPI0025562CD1|nr:hypothetical protein [Actinomadura sp. NBRC 104412]